MREDDLKSVYWCMQREIEDGYMRAIFDNFQPAAEKILKALKKKHKIFNNATLHSYRSGYQLVWTLPKHCEPYHILELQHPTLKGYKATPEEERTYKKLQRMYLLWGKRYPLLKQLMELACWTADCCRYRSPEIPKKYRIKEKV